MGVGEAALDRVSVLVGPMAPVVPVVRIPRVEGPARGCLMERRLFEVDVVVPREVLDGLVVRGQVERDVPVPVLDAAVIPPPRWTDRDRKAAVAAGDAHVETGALRPVSRAAAAAARTAGPAVPAAATATGDVGTAAGTAALTQRATPVWVGARTSDGLSPAAAAEGSGAGSTCEAASGTGGARVVAHSTTATGNEDPLAEARAADSDVRRP